MGVLNQAATLDMVSLAGLWMADASVTAVTVLQGIVPYTIHSSLEEEMPRSCTIRFSHHTDPSVWPDPQLSARTVGTMVESSERPA